jgi:hypothetical protein
MGQIVEQSNEIYGQEALLRLTAQPQAAMFLPLGRRPASR